MNLVDNIERIEGRLYRDGTGVLIIRPRSRENYLKPVQIAQRKYRIKKTRVRSACLSAWAQKQSKFMLFVTFTFPYEPSELQAAKTWKLMLDSLRNTYKITQYVWIKERQKTGRLHFHILIDRNRIGIKNLQSTWNHHIVNISPDISVSCNSVRLGSNPIVRTPQSVSKYLSKYISKTESEFTKRAWGTTVAVTSLYKKIDISTLLTNIQIGNNGYYSVTYQENVRVICETDYFIVFKLRNYFDISPP